eukprot:jgi/Tetstr1/438119/TSEL_026742.t1
MLRFVPFAVSEFGSLAPHAEAFLVELAKASHTDTGQKIGQLLSAWRRHFSLLINMVHADNDVLGGFAAAHAARDVGVRALQRQHAPAPASAAHDAALAATARWCATSDVYRKMPRTPLGGTAVGVCPAARPVLFPLLDRTLAYADRFPPTDDRSYGAEGAVCVFAGLLLRPYPSNSPVVVRKLAERRVRLWEAGDAVRAGFSALDTVDLGMVSDAAVALPALDALHPPPAATGPEYSPPEEPPDMQRAPPSWGDNADEVMRWGEDQRRVLRRAPRLSAGHVDWWRWEHIRDLDVPSWRLWVNRCLAGRGHSRTAAFLASGSVFALHKDDPAAREEREKSGEPLRVRPLGVGSVLVRLASAHALGQVGADAREVMGPMLYDRPSDLYYYATDDPGTLRV